MMSCRLEMSTPPLLNQIKYPGFMLENHKINDYKINDIYMTLVPD